MQKSAKFAVRQALAGGKWKNGDDCRRISDFLLATFVSVHNIRYMPFSLRL